MTSDTLALLSLIVVITFFAVLCGFLVVMARVVRSAAERLEAVSSITVGVRADCDLISPATEGMNLALYGVAANLSDLGDAAEALPPGVLRQREPTR